MALRADGDIQDTEDTISLEEDFRLQMEKVKVTLPSALLVF